MTAQALGSVLRRIALLLSVVTFSGCYDSPYPAKSGVAKTEKRNVGAFTEIEVDDGVQLELIARKDTTVEVTTDDNYLRRVSTRVEGSRLKIIVDFKPLYGLGVRVKVTAPGVTVISLRTIPTKEFKLHLREGGHATLSKDGHLTVSD